MAIKNTYGFSHHPYIPNSAPETQTEMLRELGLNSLEELHEEVPAELRLDRPLNIPPAFGSELELERHVEGLLAKNKSCRETLSFLGAGCWQHYVPAICDEINGRGEFLTAYGGESYNDFGRFQALFEYQSLLAELVDMEVVNVPTMDWAQAAATAIRMAARMTGKSKVLVPRLMDPQKRMIIENYCSPDLVIAEVGFDRRTGLLSLSALEQALDADTAAVYFENPGYLGIIEDRGAEISRLAREAGAECIVGVDPISLGVLAPPPSYGATIVCGDLQPLGIHMNYGGGQAGFMATMDEEKYVMEFPSRLFGITRTVEEGEYGFGDVAYDRTSFGHLREKAKEYVGTQAALWGITAGVYLATMGPKGMEDVGITILQNARYAADRLAEIPGVQSGFSAPFFKEFVVDFSKSGKTVAQINAALLEAGIFGGKDVGAEFPELGQAALYCVTEIHTKADIDRLTAAVADIVGKGGARSE